MWCSIGGGTLPYCFQFLGIPTKGERGVRRNSQTWTTTGFPISRDPPEGGTTLVRLGLPGYGSFQFLGIPPKGELYPY